MELRTLASFVAVAEERHFGRAARRRYVSPPAVTAHIAALERELGVTLLERSPVRLTAEGSRLLPHAKAMLATASAAAAAVSGGEDANQSGEVLRVGVMGHGSAELTPAVLQAFRRMHPRVSIRLCALDFDEHVSALLTHKVDLAFVRPDPRDDRLRTDVLTVEPRIVVVPKESTLADADTLQLRDILDLPFVSTPRNAPRSFTEYLHFSAARNGDRARLAGTEARNPVDVLTTVAARQGIGSALQSFARYYPWPGTKCVPVVDAAPELSVLAARAGDRRDLVGEFRTVAVSLAAAANYLRPGA